jgi:hypothetical protein
MFSMAQLEASSIWEFIEDLGSLGFERGGAELSRRIAAKLLSFPEEERAALEIVHFVKDFSVRALPAETEVLANAFVQADRARPLDLSRENFLVRVKARALERIAFLGAEDWAREIKSEHPLFSLFHARLTDTELKSLIGGHDGGAHSRSFGSLAMFAFLTMNPASEGYFPRDPFAEAARVASQLSILKDHRFWFSEEELDDYTLRIVLRRLFGAENAGKIRIETAPSGGISYSFGYDVDEEFTLEGGSVRVSLRISAVDGPSFSVNATNVNPGALSASLVKEGRVALFPGEWKVPAGHRLEIEPVSGERVCWTISVEP